MDELTPEEKPMSLNELFEKYEDDYLEFQRIPEADRRHPRPDVCAFLYLHEKLDGGERDAVAGAEHDKIWLGFDGLERLTEADVQYLSRCGVMYDDEHEALCMFA